MKSQKNFPTSKFFKKLFFTNVSLFVIPIIIGVIIFNISSKTIEKQTLDSHISILEQTKNIIDGNLREIESIATQTISNPDILKLSSIQDPFRLTNICNILDTQKSYYNFKSTNDFLIDYFVVYKNSHLILSPTLIDTLDRFYINYIEYPHMSYEEFTELVLETFHVQSYLPMKNLKIRHMSYDVVAYMRSFPYSTDRTKIVTIFFIDAAKFKKFLSGIDTSQGGGVYIIDSEQNIISSVGSVDFNELEEVLTDSYIMEKSTYIEQRNINNQDMLVSCTTSELNDWKYISIIPTNIVMKNLNRLKFSSYLIIVLLQVLGLIAAYISASRSAAPVKLLINDHSALEEAMKRQLPLLKSSFLDNLLKGEFYNHKEMYEQAKILEIDIYGKYYSVAILQLANSPHNIDQNAIIRLNKEQLIIIDLLKSITRSASIYFHSSDHDKIALLFIHKTESFKDFEVYIEEYVDKYDQVLKKNGYDNITWSIGAIYDNPLDISRSYAETLELLSYYNIQGFSSDIMYHSDLPKTADFYYFPGDIQRRLINYTKSGDFENTKQLLNDIYIENLFKRQISTYMTKALINDLWCNLFKLLEQNPFNDQAFIDNIQKLAIEQEHINLTDRLEICMDTYYNVSKKFYAHKNSHNIALIDQILDFIQNNYHDMDLSLTLIADKFSISDVYLSAFFKEQTGENFYTYLQELRIQKAKELLMQTDMPVSEIVNTIGYSSYNTFAKAFKRIVGMSATDYRTQQ